jgi:hypothetical protein
LYGEDAIIVEEVPIILSVAPNVGVYCTTVAATTTNGMLPTTVMSLPVMPMVSADPSINTSHSTSGVGDSLDNSASSGSNNNSGAIYYSTYTGDQIIQYVKRQIEYYFSEENLETDIFLRRKMDPSGYIPLSVIASFNRVKSLSQDSKLIVDAIRNSDLIEMNYVNNANGNNNGGSNAIGGVKEIDSVLVRTRSNPSKWPLAPLPPASQNVLLTQLNPNVAEFVPKTIGSSVKSVGEYNSASSSNNNANNNTNNSNNNSNSQAVQIATPQALVI